MGEDELGGAGLCASTAGVAAEEGLEGAQDELPATASASGPQRSREKPRANLGGRARSKYAQGSLRCLGSQFNDTSLGFIQKC